MILVGPFQVSIFCDPVVLSLFGSGFVTLSVTPVLSPQGALRVLRGRARASPSRTRARRHTAHAPN